MPKRRKHATNLYNKHAIEGARHLASHGAFVDDSVSSRTIEAESYSSGFLLDKGVADRPKSVTISGTLEQASSDTGLQCDDQFIGTATLSLDRLQDRGGIGPESGFSSPASVVSARLPPSPGDDCYYDDDFDEYDEIGDNDGSAGMEISAQNHKAAPPPASSLDWSAELSLLGEELGMMQTEVEEGSSFDTSSNGGTVRGMALCDGGEQIATLMQRNNANSELSSGRSHSFTPSITRYNTIAGSAHSDSLSHSSSSSASTSAVPRTVAAQAQARASAAMVASSFLKDSALQTELRADVSSHSTVAKALKFTPQPPHSSLDASSSTSASFTLDTGLTSSQGTTSSSADSCGVCLLPLVDESSIAGGSGRSSGPLSSASLSALFSMPCCGSAVHLDCIEQCTQLRAIRKHCCVCQEPFREGLIKDVEAAVRAAAEHKRAAQRAVLSALAHGSKLLLASSASASASGITY